MPRTRRSEPLTYRYTEDGDRRMVNGMHPEKGIVAHLSAEPQRDPGKGLATSLAFVHPDFRRQGVATAMFNIMSNQVGYTLTQDSARSPMGDAWAKSTGAPLPPRVPMKQWDMTPEEASNNLPERQSANWQKGTPIDPTVSNALTPPPKPPRQKKTEQPEQLNMDAELGLAPAAAPRLTPMDVLAQRKAKRGDQPA